MYFLYIDESGYTGNRLDDANQPVLAMAGILVNQYHWRKSWEDFKQFCDEFRNKFGVDFKELRAADVYAGRGQWSNASHSRHELLEYCLNWMKVRPHRIISAAVVKKSLESERDPLQKMLFRSNKNNLSKLSPYLLSALHLSLMFQRYLECLGQEAYKALGMIIFDEQKQEQDALLDLLISPPKSVTGFTNRISKEGFCCIMDNAYFMGSHCSSFIQLADIISFVIRKFAELEMGSTESYKGEKNKIEDWFSTIKNSFIEKRHRFPVSCKVVETYRKITPKILL